MLTSVLFNTGHGIQDHFFLLLFRHAIGVARVVDTVAEKFPVALGAQGDNFRVMVAQGGRKRDRPPYAVFIQHLHLPYMAYPVTPVSYTVPG